MVVINRPADLPPEHALPMPTSFSILSYLVMNIQIASKQVLLRVLAQKPTPVSDIMVKSIRNNDNLIFAASPPIHNHSKFLVIFIIADPSAHETIKQSQEFMCLYLSVW